MHNQMLALFLAVAAIAPSQPAQSQQVTDMRFNQALSLRSAEGSTQPLNVNLRNWVVRNLQTASLTATGMLVIHVRAGGPAVTVIDGQRAQREEGDFFVVPPGAMLSVETQNETVVFSVLEVRR